MENPGPKIQTDSNIFKDVVYEDRYLTDQLLMSSIQVAADCWAAGSRLVIKLVLVNTAYEFYLCHHRYRPCLRAVYLVHPVASRGPR